MLYISNTKKICQYLSEKKEKTAADERQLAELLPTVRFHGEKFAAYKELFFDDKYWARQPYWKKLKESWNWFQPKSSKNHVPVYAYDGLFERMLEPKSPASKSSLWIGLRPRAFTTILDCIDIDNQPKNYCRKAGRGFFLKVKTVFDAFPERVWCLSSGSGGIHSWRMQTALVLQQFRERNDRFKTLGLEGVEQHPNFERCLRRPFGQDYFTLTENGIIETWWEQLDFFLNPQPVTFECLLHHLRNFFVDAKEGFEEIAKPSLLLEPAVLEVKERVKTESLLKERFRNGRMALELEKFVQHGLEEKGQLHEVLCEIAVYLWWVELYRLDPEEREKTIRAALHAWVEQKHNEQVSDWEHAMQKINGAIELAKRERSDEQEKYLLSMRERQERGQYKRVIRLMPILEGKTSSTLSSILLSLMCPPFELPSSINVKIGKMAGRMKILPFAEKLLHYLVRKEGRARISRSTMMEMARSNAKNIDKYKKLLVEAGIITQGTSYSSHLHYSKEYRLTPWAAQELAKASLEDSIDPSLFDPAQAILARS